MRFRVIKNEKLTKRQTDGPTVQPTWAMHYFYLPNTQNQLSWHKRMIQLYWACISKEKGYYLEKYNDALKQ